MTVFAVFAAIAIAFVVYFNQPECRLRGEPPCVEEQAAPDSQVQPDEMRE